MPKRPKPKRRIGRAARARIGYFLGLLVFAAGLFLAIGLGWALVGFGVGTVAYWVWLYDVDEPEPFDPDADVRFR